MLQRAWRVQGKGKWGILVSIEMWKSLCMCNVKKQTSRAKGEGAQGEVSRE